MSVLVGEIVARLDDAFPYSWAESWDRVGLVVGDPSAEVRGVLVSLDADLPTLERAQESGANVLITHHPPFLETPAVVTPDSAPALWYSTTHKISIVSAHTNLDRSPLAAGVLLDSLGLPAGEPIEVSPAEESLITVYVPAQSADDVHKALAASGAGRISGYDACSFTSEGAGRFAPRPEAAPMSEQDGEPVPEVRVEAVAPPSRATAIVRSVRAAHPYEEPLITVTTIARSRGGVALGRVADVEEITLGSLVHLVADRFDCTPRVWGDPAVSVTRVATATGSASSLVKAAIATGANALVAGEVRYHDALDAMHSGLAVIEAGHDVTEWPLVPILAHEIAALVGAERVITEEPTRGWWTP